ncbi:hypothetical protein U91I_03154 [alpha proteobacterium U9-1i]|nr:hypothetical protein U91I_03154 [alpha proteobacterium U9-1i]
MYHILFCDDAEAFRAVSEGPEGTRFAPIFASTFDEAALRTIADDLKVESRLRLLAANRLRAEGCDTGPKRLLGIVAEVGLEGGLDTLAAYADGRVRYINQTGKMSIIEGEAPPLGARTSSLFEKAKTLLARIGPWHGDRLAPPRAGDARLTFLATDGLYFGHGPMADLSRDPLAAPVMLAAAELLNATVEFSLAAQRR